MKIHEKKLTGIAILLVLTLVLAAGAYLIYRAWDYWSADQTYADMGRSSVRKVKMTEKADKNSEAMFFDGAENTGEVGDALGPLKASSGDKEGHESDDEDFAANYIEGAAIPDRPVIDWDELTKSGRDIVAWLDIPALGIAYPVVRGDDNEFYLHHLPNGEYKNAGSLFMETANSPDLTDINTVIYGHNMDNGSMFGKFRSMTVDDYSRQPFLWLCTREKACLYAMISLHISHVDDESYTLFESTGRAPAANGAGTCLFDSADSTVTGWIFDENRRSYINMPIPKSALIRVVTLSTCASLSDERRVLQAILVREVKNTVERNEGQIK